MLTDAEFENLRNILMAYMIRQGDMARKYREDCVQNTLISLWKELERGVEIRDPRAWVFTTCRRELWAMLKKEAKYLPLPETRADGKERVVPEFLDESDPESVAICEQEMARFEKVVELMDIKAEVGSLTSAQRMQVMRERKRFKEERGYGPRLQEGKDMVNRVQEAGEER